MSKKLVISDTGFIVALLNQTDQKHNDVSVVYLQHEKILLPQTVLVEVAYLVKREAGIKTVIRFLENLPTSRFSIIALTEEDLDRTAQILDNYSDSNLDFVDATVMAIAERYKIAQVLTLDQRDFRLFRPRHCESFEILP